jgi:MoaA/NifB/PqqE/SkfB family radical SAM enzyme
MSFVPADHSATVENIGLGNTLKLITKAAFGYRHTVMFYLRTHQFSSLDNFLFTKTLVPTGEGSGEALYYIIGPLLQKYPKLIPYPRNIEIEVTTRCNKRCIICEHTWWSEKNVDLDYNTFVRTVDQLPLRWINLTGEGDAFLNKDYLHMIAYLKKKHISTYLTDSFDLIDKNTTNYLVQAGVSGIYISMDAATKETYESIKVGCDYDRVINNIKYLLQEKKRLNTPLPEICFRYVINKKNKDEMIDFVEVVRKLGTRSEWGDGSKIHFIGLLDFPEVHSLYVDKIPKPSFPQNGGYMPIIYAHSEQSTNPNINRCLAWGEPYLMLVPTPTVLPCCAVMMANAREKLIDYGFGDYTKESIKDIWNHPYYKWFRSQVTKQNRKVPALCEGCRAYDTKERELYYGVDRRKREDFE